MHSDETTRRGRTRGFETSSLPIYACWPSKPRMTITAALASDWTRDQARAGAKSEAFVAEIDYCCGGRTEPAQHDDGVRLFVLEGGMRLTDVQDSKFTPCGPGTKAYVSAGTAHTEGHDSLKMIGARRFSRSGVFAHP